MLTENKPVNISSPHSVKSCRMLSSFNTYLNTELLQEEELHGLCISFMCEAAAARWAPAASRVVTDTVCAHGGNARLRLHLTVHTPNILFPLWGEGLRHTETSEPDVRLMETSSSSTPMGAHTTRLSWLHSHLEDNTSLKAFITV